MKKTPVQQIILISVITAACFSCGITPKDPKDKAVVSGAENKKTIWVTDSVPPVITVSSELKRIVVVRLKNKTDMLEGLNEAVKAEGIKNGIILHGIGSVISYNVHSVGETTEFPVVNVYAKEDGPYDLLTVSGFVFSGRVHAHITLSDLKTTIGGHLEPGTLAYTFLIISIGVLDDNIDMDQFDDWTWK